MSYSGYFFRVGSYVVPMDVIYADSYKCVKTIIDLDAFRDANGVLQRNALDNVPFKVEFQLKPMYEKTLRDIMNNIRANYSNAKERKAHCTFFDFESGDYVSQDMYMPDINFQVYGVFNGIIQYDATTLKFIGY